MYDDQSGAGRAQVRSLNDTFRRSMTGGDVVLTPGIHSLEKDVQSSVIEQVAGFDDFSPDNDPYGEHDFGSVEIDGRQIFWKIDYYDPTLRSGSSDPSDPLRTRRVLTIMLAEEY